MNPFLPRASGALIVVGLIAVLLFFVRVAVRSYLGERSDFLRWPPAQISRHPDRTGIPGLEEVEFAGPDAIRLAGWYAPSKNRAAIVLAHGTNADRSAVLPETRILAAAGFGVLAFDFPGQGASQGKTLWGGPERESIRAAVDWLARRPEVDAARIGGLGMSMGGYIMAQAAALDPRLRAVVLGAAPSDTVEQTRFASNQWGLLTELPAVWALKASGMPYATMQPRDIVGEIAPRALFILGGELDPVVPPAMARTLFAAAKDPKQLWIVPGARHCDYDEVAPQEYARRLREFFGAALLD